MDKKKIKYYLIPLIFLMSLFIYSQGSIKQPPFPKPDGPEIPQTPIDGGITLLLIIGTAFGVYNKLKEK